MNGKAGHYDEEYWAYQKEVGEAGGILNLFKFQDLIHPDQTILDFGCGGGFLLNNIQCKKKIGFEISDHARAHAESLGLQVVSSFSELENSSLDLIVSNHCLEHVPNPLESLQNLLTKLKPAGRIAIVVPCEQPTDPTFGYDPSDINKHLFTWCPMTLGNLAAHAGFNVLASDALRHQWTPDYLTAYKSMPLDEYHQRCFAHAQQTGNFQVRTIAEKPR